MKRESHFLEYLYCLLLVVFLIGRTVFLFYNRAVGEFNFWDMLGVYRSGLLAHDVVVAAFLLLVPGLVALCSLRYSGLPLRKVLTPYYILMGVLVGIIIMADVVMYEFWQFKLGAVMLSYAASPEGTTNSVSIQFLLVRLLSMLGFILLITVPCILLTPSKMPTHPSVRYWYRNLSIIWLFLLFMGVFVRVGDAYRPGRSLFLNHASVNPVYSFVHSFPWSASYDGQFNYFKEEERAELVRGLYPEDTEDMADTLLTTRQPDVLVVLIESFGGKFISELGGLPDVAPNFSRLIPQGIFWDNYYSNSFRTDRGTVSAFSGYLAYPDVSLMTHPEMHGSIPSLAASLVRQGYSTSYLYAGPMTNMGKRDYLADMQFQHLLDDTAFTPEELNSTWGANDSTAAMKAYHLIAQRDSSERWMMTFQTLSSHEPWVVPYHRLEDEKLNAFAYTDQCLGDLVDSLQTLPQWDNMLVILIPDHGFLYQQTYEDPEFFHSPMLWLGGAIRQPRRMHQLMNQSDLAATLLSQMGISHRDYPWSRNVLSSSYTHPFVYCNFPEGFLYRDDTGYSIYDLSADRIIVERPADPMGLRTLRGQAILQTSYDQLDGLR